MDAWIEEAVKEFGKLDGAANVAGLSIRHPDTTSANIVGDTSIPLDELKLNTSRFKKTGIEQSLST